jgi:hypothetical protein
LEEILTAKSKKFRYKASLSLPSFFGGEPLVRFDFAANFFFKVCCFKGILTLKKVNAGSLEY